MCQWWVTCRQNDDDAEERLSSVIQVTRVSTVSTQHGQSPLFPSRKGLSTCGKRPTLLTLGQLHKWMSFQINLCKSFLLLGFNLGLIWGRFESWATIVRHSTTLGKYCPLNCPLSFRERRSLHSSQYIWLPHPRSTFKVIFSVPGQKIRKLFYYNSTEKVFYKMRLKWGNWAFPESYLHPQVEVVSAQTRVDSPLQMTE